jgi:adenine-specific DNA glycosylase
VPDEFKLHAHHWLILHGRYVCLARSPQCAACTIRDLCEISSEDRIDRHFQMFNPSRDEARRFVVESWRKRREG